MNKRKIIQKLIIKMLIGTVFVGTAVIAPNLNINLKNGVALRIGLKAYAATNIVANNVFSGVNGENTFYTDSDGNVWGCGDNYYGQLGIGNTTVDQSSLIQIPISNVKQVICGGNYTIFIKNDGTVWGCGFNKFGQLGLYYTSNQLLPIQIPITDVKQVICGINHTIFIKNDGTIWGCGENAYGELGIGDNYTRYVPQQISITDVKQVLCAGFNTIFVKNDGTVWGCGYNYRGELGIGNTIDKHSPVQITGVTVVPTDNTAPTAPNISIEGNQLTITSGTDTGSRVKETDYQLNNGAWTKYTAPVTLADGNYTINAKTIDNAGNESTITSTTANVYTTALANATNAVTVAENTKSQADLNTAKSLVEALPDSVDKTALENRLSALQSTTTASTTNSSDDLKAVELTVEIAESLKREPYITNAQNAINSLVDSPEKTAFQIRLDKVKGNH